jgi:DNA-binding NarL/FixJ family response regulator
MKPYRIILADDHALFRQGIKKIIEEVDGLEVVGEAPDGLALLLLLKKITPDLVILDIAMPNMRGLEAAREIRKLYPQVKVMLLTMHKKAIFLQQGVAAGVDGFLVKEVADTELVEAILAIRAGKKFFSTQVSDELAGLAQQPEVDDPLSKREKEVAKLLSEGKSSKEIGELLYISKHTVRRHRDSIMRKLQLKSLADLVRYALTQGYTLNDS